jgi:DNA-binding HxlR family transcriptional regulator
LEEDVGDTKVDKDILAAELFEAISHPTRIQILKTLEETPHGFSELKHELGISSSGNLTHHLSKLSTLVGTNAQGKYVLTDQGREALHVISITKATNGGWMTTTYAIISALVFYAIYMTVSLVSGRADSLTPVSAVISTAIFFIIFWTILVRTRQNRTATFGWRYSMNKGKQS